jgi:hypothetical protein
VDKTNSRLAPATAQRFSPKKHYAEQPLALLLLRLFGLEDVRVPSTICAKITTHAAASVRRAHHKCSVLGCPCRIDFSRAEATWMASNGSATSIRFLLIFMVCKPEL